ncbi:hypothetical protein Tco_0053427 [Tanacetum coccineum]
MTFAFGKPALRSYGSCPKTLLFGKSYKNIRFYFKVKMKETEINEGRTSYELRKSQRHNSQVKNCKIDLLTTKNTRLFSQSLLKKTIDAVPLIHTSNVTAIEEAKDLATLLLDELIGNLKVYEMVLDNDGVGSKTTKEKVKYLALKAKATREKTSDDSDSQGQSDEDIDEEAEAFNLLARNFRKFLRKGNRFERGNRFGNNGNRFGKGRGTFVSERRKRRLKNLRKLSSEINDLKIEVKKLVNKEVVEPCLKCVELTQEVDSLTSNGSKLQDEALNFSKFKSSSIALEQYAKSSKFFPDKEVLDFQNVKTNFRKKS